MSLKTIDVTSANQHFINVDSAIVVDTLAVHQKLKSANQSSFRQQDENSLLVVYCLTGGHAFDWTKPSVVLGSSTKKIVEGIEA